MIDQTTAIALLFKRAVLATFDDEDASPRVRVNCLERHEISALVALLKEWRPAGGQMVRVAVTARSPWAGLAESDIVPNLGESPTTLRNARGMWVILIEGDDYTDKQGWANVLQISDRNLLDSDEARRELAALFLGSEPPRVLIDVLEEVYAILGSEDEGHVPVRNWVRLVQSAAEALSGAQVLDSVAVWNVVGFVLPSGGLFADDRLGEVNATDRKRLLRRNARESARIVAGSDEGWRDRMRELVDRIEFVERDAQPTIDQDAVRSAASVVLDTFGREATRGLMFRYWEQLIGGGKAQKGLGARIRESLEQEHPHRLPEFEALGVEEGINANCAEDAERLLGHVSDDEANPPLPSLLNRKQRSALERVAKPRAPRTTRPLSDLVRVIADMVSERDTLADEADQVGAASLKIEPYASTKENEHSRGLFAWLFGPTLSLLADNCADKPLSLDLSADLVDRIKSLSFEHESETETDADDQDGADLFNVLELRLSWSDGVGSERRIEWDPSETPGLVALWRFCAGPDVVYWAPTQDVSFEDWLSGALQRISMLGPVSASIDGETPNVVHDWDRTRAMYLSRLSSEGLAANVIRAYVDEFQDLLERIRSDHVPAGVGRPEAAAVLSRDFFLSGDSVACLASHPLRLRWIGNYLKWMTNLMERALLRELVTNPVNPDLFFEQMLDVSPQAQPPIAVFEERLLLAVRENDWHEVYAPLKDSRGEKRDWLADLDDGAIDDVAETVGRYLGAYPHKADGLHLLFIVRRYGARGLHRLVKQVIERIGIGGASLKLTLFVDTKEVRAVEEVLQDFDDPDHRAVSDRPPLQIDLHPWPEPDEKLPDVTPVGPFVDLAVVPNLFGASTRTQESTIGGSFQAGHFKPLLDAPTRLEAVRTSEGRSTTVSRVLLPEGRDPLLESWSTIVTRQFRGTPVSESPRGDDVDHVTIRVSLDRNRAFFEALHACAHWVVTIDAFVGREQIEGLEGGPDVIQVKTGVGANGGYRMVVSSKVGRDFVQARVARRLREQISPSALPDPNLPAGEIYQRASLLVPGIVLRSLGLGRTTAEMVGLVLARHRLEQVDPAYVGPHGFQSWISLDEYREWSGGHSKVRADLARLRGRVLDGRLKLRVDVVEAKMRPHPAVGQADAQLNRSIELLSAALGGDSDAGVEYADKDVWSRLIWRAIDQSSYAADEAPAATHAVTQEGRAVGVDRFVQAAIREGGFELEAVEGVLVSLTDDPVGEDSRTPSGHRWLKITMDEVAEILASLSSSKAYPLLTREICDGSSDQTLRGGDEQNSKSTTDQDPESSGMRGRVDLEETSDKEPDHEPDAKGAEPRGGATKVARRRLQELIDALHLRNVEVRPSGTENALEGPGFYLFRVELGRNVRPEAVFALDTHLQYQLGLEAGQTPRLYVDRGAMVVEIPKREEERYYVVAEELWKRFQWPANRLVAPLGYNVRDQPVAIDFSSSRSPHLLIGGMTGGGKSVALEALLLSLVRHYSSERLELRIIDPKGNEFTQFEGLAHVPDTPGVDAEDAIEMLERTCEEMDERYRAMKRLSQERKIRVRDIAEYNDLVDPSDAFKWIVVVLDEFADLTSEKDHKKAIEALLQRVAQKARACGIHAIVATQKPSAEVISTTTRSNLGAQLALRVRSAIDSKVIMEAAGAESLAGNGDAFLRLSGEEPVRIQCAKVD